MVEVMAQTSVEPGGRMVTREELFNELKELTEQVSRLTSYSRKRSSARPDGQLEIEAPEGYASYRDYRLHRLIDWAFNHNTQHGMSGTPTWHDRYFTMVDEIRLERDRLRVSAARRTGDPCNNGRWQNRAQWQRWASGDPGPWSVRLIRRWARVRFDDDMPYEQTLWEVANQVMMYSGALLDRRRADSIKKSVDREYQYQHDELPPKPPRGWWHPAADAGELTPGGLTVLGLTWDPRPNLLITHWDTPPRTGEHAWFDEARA